MSVSVVCEGGGKNNENKTDFSRYLFYFDVCGGFAVMYGDGGVCRDRRSNGADNNKAADSP